MSSDSQQSMTKEVKKKQQKNVIPDTYQMKILDYLPTISPITSIMQLPNHNDEDENQVNSNIDDLIIASGHQQSAQLTLVRSQRKSFLAVDNNIFPMGKQNGVQQVFSFNMEKIISDTPNEVLDVKQFIVLSITDSTKFCQFENNNITEIGSIQKDDQQVSFNGHEQTISCQKICNDQILQVTETELILLKYDFQEKKFARTKS